MGRAPIREGPVHDDVPVLAVPLCRCPRGFGTEGMAPQEARHRIPTGTADELQDIGIRRLCAQPARSRGSPASGLIPAFGLRLRRRGFGGRRSRFRGCRIDPFTWWGFDRSLGDRLDGSRTGLAGADWDSDHWPRPRCLWAVRRLGGPQRVAGSDHPPPQEVGPRVSAAGSPRVRPRPLERKAA